MSESLTRVAMIGLGSDKNRMGDWHPSSIPLSNVSFYVPILGSKKGTCLSDGPALRGCQKEKLTYSFERISCSGHLKSESAVVRVH